MSSQDETCLLTKLHGGLLEAIKTFQKTSIEKEAIDSEGLLTSLLDHIMPTTRSFGNKKPTKVRDSYADKVINTSNLFKFNTHYEIIFMRNTFRWLETMLRQVIDGWG